MTTPTIVGVTADFSNPGGGAGYSKVLSLPVGTVEGDLMIAAEATDGAYNTWNMPSGPSWTTIWAGHNEGGNYINMGGPLGLFLKWAFVPASPPSSYTFTNANAGSGNEFTAMGLMVIRGVDPVSPIRAVAYSNRSMDNNELGTTPTLTAVADDLVLSIWAWLAAYEVFSIDVSDIAIDARNTAGAYLLIGDDVASGGTTTARHMSAIANTAGRGWQSGQIAIAPGVAPFETSDTVGGSDSASRALTAARAVADTVSGTDSVVTDIVSDSPPPPTSTAPSGMRVRSLPIESHGA